MELEGKEYYEKLCQIFGNLTEKEYWQIANSDDAYEDYKDGHEICG